MLIVYSIERHLVVANTSLLLSHSLDYRVPATVGDSRRPFHHLLPPFCSPHGRLRVLVPDPFFHIFQPLVSLMPVSFGAYLQYC